MAQKTIEERLQELEDHDAIRQVVAAYGYSVDGCDTDAVGNLYIEDGVYAVGDIATYEGRDKVAAITKEPGHIRLVEAGCAHISLPPFVAVEGDLGVATCHTMVPCHSEDGFFLWRLSASRIELVRQTDGEWKIEKRRNWMLDGNSNGPQMLAQLRQVRL